MKILITSELYKGTINGVVVSVKNLEKDLLKMGHDVRILTVSEKSRSYIEDNVYYINSVPTRIYTNIRVPFTLKHRFIDQLIDWQPDIIHTQSEFFTFTYAKMIRKATGAVIIHTSHTLYEQYTEYFPIGNSMGELLYKTSFKPWLKSRLSICKSIIVPSKKTLEVLRNCEIDVPINVVPTGIDIDKFRAFKCPEEIENKKAELGIEKDEKVLIVLSRLGYEKNISELLFGTSNLIKENGKIKFIIAGDGPAKADLVRLSKSLNIDDKVIFTGMINPSDVPLYYQISDIFISASTSETQGLTYIEALASGLPLVCKKDPCLDELLISGENGFLYEKIDDLAKHIETTLEKLPGVNETSKKISERYSIETFSRNVYKLYSDLIK